MGPKGILAIIAKGKPKGMMEEEEEDEGMHDESHGDMLAEILGVPEEDKGTFLEALKGFIQSC